MSSSNKRVIKTLDDYIDEASMLLSFDDVEFSVTNLLEQYFFDIADKHGILDAIFDERDL